MKSSRQSRKCDVIRIRPYHPVCIFASFNAKQSLQGDFWHMLLHVQRHITASREQSAIHNVKNFVRD